MIFVVGGGGSGGGLDPSKPLIHVNAPLGSTVDIILSSLIIATIPPSQAFSNSDGETADYYYSCPSTGTYTVTATLSPDTASDTIVVSANEQFDVQLIYGTWLFRNGAATSITGGVEFVAGSSLSDGYIHTAQNTNTGNYWEFVNALDVLAYGRYLHYRIRVTESYSGRAPYLGTFSPKLASGSYDSNESKRKAVNEIAVNPDFVDGYVDLSTLVLGNSYYVGYLSISTSDLESMWISDVI